MSSPERTIPQEMPSPTDGGSNSIEKQSRSVEAPGRTLDHVLSHSWDVALESESYEETSSTLSELRALRSWRNQRSRSRFRDFYDLFEQASLLEKDTLTHAERKTVKEEMVDGLTAKAHGQTPRVADLFMGLLSEIDGTPYTPQYEMTGEKIAQLRESGDLSLLLSPNIPFEVKLNRFNTRLEGELIGRRALDRQDRQRKEQLDEEQKPDDSESPSTPPPADEESKPSMDEMERTPEGESAPAIWTISPAWGGYYKGRSFDRWDSSKNVWCRDNPQYTEASNLEAEAVARTGELTMRANVNPGQWVELNIPYTHHLVGLSAESGKTLVQRDQNGDYILMIQASTPSPVAVSIYLAEREEPNALVQANPPEKLQFNSLLSSETLSAIEQIGKQKKGNLARARAISRLVMQRLKYSNNSALNAVYESHPDGYIAAIDQHREADCDVANTYFAACCAVLNIPVRHVVGHMVKGKDNEGNTRITSGTGHAWSEIWDSERNEWVKTGREWIRLDATPPGDPQLDEEEQAQTQSESAPGDYGSREEVGPTDDQLKDLEVKLTNLAEQLQYTPAERQLAEATGIELKEARDITREMAVAEETRLPSGERIVDVLSKIFSLIIESRRASASSYAGPLRKREGGEYIDDIVAHKIGIVAGDFDPVSRQKEVVAPRLEQVFGGFDLYFVGDKSGSMGNTVDGEEKWRLQRRAQYLILSSLFRFELSLMAAQVHMKDSLSIRTQAISFRDANKIDVDKSLSSTFSPEDKVRLWRSLGNQGSGNGDMAALSMIEEQISEERQAVLDQGGEDNRLRLVIACSDGYPDDVAGVHHFAEALGRLNAVVVGVGLTETAAQVPIIFDTPFSRGDIARDINDLPVIAARLIVQEALKLFPEKSHSTLLPYLETVVQKFRVKE